jgi:hypothetical protein
MFTCVRCSVLRMASSNLERLCSVACRGLDHLQQLPDKGLHLQNESENNIVEAPADAACGSAICDCSPPRMHFWGYLPSSAIQLPRAPRCSLPFPPRSRCILSPRCSLRPPPLLLRRRAPTATSGRRRRARCLDGNLGSRLEDSGDDPICGARRLVWISTRAEAEQGPVTGEEVVAARAGDGGGGGRAGWRRRRWWPDPAQAISRSTSEAAQHLRGGRLLPFPGHLRLRLLGLRDARGHRRRRAAEEEKVRDSGPTWRRHCCRARSRGGGRDAPRTPLPPPQVYSSDGRKGIRRRRTSSLLRLVRPLRSAMAGANYHGRCRTGWASSAGSCSVCSMGFFSLLSS